MDRIDIHKQVARVEFEKFNDDRLGESSDTILIRLENARQSQHDRFLK